MASKSSPEEAASSSSAVDSLTLLKLLVDNTRTVYRLVRELEASEGNPQPWRPILEQLQSLDPSINHSNYSPLKALQVARAFGWTAKTKQESTKSSLPTIRRHAQVIADARNKAMAKKKAPEGPYVCPGPRVCNLFRAEKSPLEALVSEEWFADMTQLHIGEYNPDLEVLLSFILTKDEPGRELAALCPCGTTHDDLWLKMDNLISFELGKMYDKLRSACTVLARNFVESYKASKGKRSMNQTDMDVEESAPPARRGRPPNSTRPNPSTQPLEEQIRIWEERLIKARNNVNNAEEQIRRLKEVQRRGPEE